MGLFNKKFFLYTYMFYAIVSILTIFMYIFKIGNFIEFNTIVYIPLIFLFCLILYIYFLHKNYRRNYGSLFVITMLFIRNSLGILFTLIGNMKTLFPLPLVEEFNNAVLLVIYEELCIFFLLYYFIFRKDKRLYNKKIIIPKFLKNINYILIALCLVIYIVYYDYLSLIYRDLFSFILNKEKDVIIDTNVLLPPGSIKRYACTIFHLLISVVRISLSTELIIRFSANQNFPSLIKSLLVVFVQFMLIPESVFAFLMVVVIDVFFIIELYPRYAKKLMTTCFLFVIVFTVFVFSFSYENLMKWYNFSNFNEYLSNFFNTYFSGVFNVANALKLPSLNSSQTFDLFIGTLIKVIPFNTILFPQLSNLPDIDSFYYLLPLTGGQIIPTISIGNYFFTFIFSPIFSVIFTYFSLYFGMKYENNNIYIKVAYFYVITQFALGVGMYNLPITLIHFLQVGIPLLIIMFVLQNIFNSKNVSVERNCLYYE